MFLEPDPFLNELHKMYERHASKGTVFITMKRSNLKPRKTKKAPPPPEDYRCLIRAGDGKKTISTTVPTTQHAKFANSINVIMKAHMGALKKKEKEKKKDKEKEQQH
mmetsp:Transcript_13161/g.35834  ORF Transcript_13161/g.35834 Transcript_13161/m.35834 type:complete len:107 (+) Transcript_13161:46-366(+)